MLVLFCTLALALPACSGRSDALERVREMGVLRVALDPSFPPFEFVGADGTLAGLDVDLAQRIAARLGVQAQFVTTGYDALYDALTVGRADVIISALYPDPSQMHAFAFSPAYFNAGEVLLVPERSPIQDVTDLGGKQVALVFGTEGHMVALKWEKTMSPPPQILPGDSPDTVVSVLAAGKVDAAIVDNVTAHTSLAHTPDLRVLPPRITDEPYAIAARKEDTSLARAIQEVLLDMQDSGELNTLIQRWMR